MTPPTYRICVVAPVRPVVTDAVPVIVDDAAMVVTLVNAPVIAAPPVVTVSPAATVSTPALVRLAMVLDPAAFSHVRPFVDCTLIDGVPVLPDKSSNGDAPFNVTFPEVIVMPPLATVRPVKPFSVPVIVLLPVMDAPPLATVNPVNPPSVPVIVLFPVTAMAAENVCNALNVCAVPLCAAYVLIVAMFGLRYVPNRSARSVDADGTARANGLPVVVAGTSRLRFQPSADDR